MRAVNFIRKYNEHFEKAKIDAETSGGTVVRSCKTPSGDEIRVRDVSLEDDHFVSVKGIDEFGQTRDFKAHHSGVGITSK